MADVKISQLPTANTPLTGTELVPVVQAGSTVKVSTANIMSQALIGQALYPRTAAEIAAGVTPTNYAYPPYNALRYGAVGDDSTDNTTALQNWINVCSEAGDAGYLPCGQYRHGSLTITDLSVEGFRMYGDSSGDYGTSANNAPTRGSILKYTGTGTGLTIDGGQEPKYLRFDGITFVGNSVADDGVLITRSTWLSFVNCGWYGYTQTNGNAVRLTIGSGTFTGCIRFLECFFAGNYRAVYAETSPINIVSFYHTDFHSNSYGFVQPSGASYFIRHLRFVDCDFEETLYSDVSLESGVAAFTFRDNYVEQNNASYNAARIYSPGNASSPVTQAVIIEGNVFSKSLPTAGDRLMYFNRVYGLRISDNWSAYPTSGTVTDRWSVETGATVSNLEIDVPNVVFGMTAYPLRINGTSYTVDYDTTSRDFRGTSLLRDGAQIITSRNIGNTQSSNYTFVLTDAGSNKIVVNGGATTTYTVPPQSNVTWGANDEINILNSNSTQNLTVARGSGVEIYLANTNQDLTVAPRRFVKLRRVSTDVWIVAESAGGIT